MGQIISELIQDIENIYWDVIMGDPVEIQGVTQVSIFT